MLDVTAGGVERTSLSDGTVRISGGGHLALVTRLKPGCLLVTERGTQTSETRAAMIREIEREMAEKAPAKIFVDLRASNRMDTAGRDEWAAFGKRRQGDVGGVVVLVRSKLLEMAFSVMGMFVGGGVIRVVSSEADLVSEIQREVPSFRGLPALVSAER